jgi:polysaccharide pyruvyl transferase WcaK-like protein
MSSGPEHSNPNRARRRILLIAGFYGRGNAGDEALLQCLCEAFEDDFEIAIAVDEHGAYPGFWDWYPYAGRRIVHQKDLDFVHRTPNLAGVVVGGGSLSLAFGADLLLEAAARGVPVAVTGVDLMGEAEALHRRHPALSTAWRDILAHLMVRSSASAQRAAALRLRALHGADLALRLPVDASAEIERDRRRAAIVIRERQPSGDMEAVAGEARALIGAVEAAGQRPVFLPFAPEDTRFLAALGIADLAPVFESWWNPRRLKQLIAESGLIVSMGRLHPIIFAAPTATPVAAIGMATPDGRRHPSKLPELAADLGVSYFEDLGDLVHAVAHRRIPAADPASVAAAVTRLDETLATLRGTLRGPAAG